MKILLFIALSILVVCQYVLIYNLGDFIDLFESFGTDLPNFSEWVIAMSQTKNNLADTKI